MAGATSLVAPIALQRFALTGGLSAHIYTVETIHYPTPLARCRCGNEAGVTVQCIACSMVSADEAGLLFNLTRARGSVLVIKSCSADDFCG
jgi:hypothetical protein